MGQSREEGVDTIASIDCCPVGKEARECASCKMLPNPEPPLNSSSQPAFLPGAEVLSSACISPVWSHSYVHEF